MFPVKVNPESRLKLDAIETLEISQGFFSMFTYGANSAYFMWLLVNVKGDISTSLMWLLRFCGEEPHHIYGSSWLWFSTSY